MSKEEKAVTIPENTAVSTIDDTSMLDVIKSGGYLGRLQLMTSGTKQCKNGEFPINHFAVVNDSVFQDLGTEVDILVLGQRLKALDMSGDDVISCFDPKIVDKVPTGIFKEIQDKSNEKDSGCMWGPEFLVYIGSEKCFATFFMGSKSSRRDAPTMIARKGSAVTLRPKKIETKKYTWFSPAITACSTPIEPPSPEDITTQLEKFTNPPETQIEKAEKTDADEQAR